MTETGFLGDYSQLTPTDNKDQALLRYVDPNAAWSTYTMVRLEPVTFWAGRDSQISPQVQQKLCDYAYAKIKEALVAKGYQIVTTGGPGVMVLRAAITDPTSATPVLRTISVVVPQARLLTAATGLVTGEQAFAGSIQGEGEILDSVTHTRLAAWVDKRSGGGSIKNAGAWKWGDAETVINFWATTLATRLVQFRQGQAS
ncbi:MAG TPA: DUF3313 domain-containing protein [Acetobacteraceae bacterium]|nr:DUF3313 domain-containing protein [Acetobacteraceae bacterium]